MDAFAAYILFNALRLHFTSNYDFIKYQGRVPHLETRKVQEKFLRNNQRFFFHNLSRFEDPKGLCIANMLAKPKIYINDLLSDESKSNWTKWVARNQSISYVFETELTKNNNYTNIFKISESGLPILLNYYISGVISPETLVIINSIGNVFEEWKSIPHPLIQDKLTPLINYAPFVIFDKKRCKSILKQIITSK